MGKKRLVSRSDMKLGIIGDEDTVTGLVLGGAGMVDGNGKKNFFICETKTKPAEIQAAFTEMTMRTDISIIIITQTVAGEIRHVVDDYARSGKVVPAVLEIPTKDVPYDPKKDPIMQRVQMFFGGNIVV